MNKYNYVILLSFVALNAYAGGEEHNFLAEQIKARRAKMNEASEVSRSRSIHVEEARAEVATTPAPSFNPMLLEQIRQGVKTLKQVSVSEKAPGVKNETVSLNTALLSRISDKQQKHNPNNDFEQDFEDDDFGSSSGR